MKNSGLTFFFAGSSLLQKECHQFCDKFIGMVAFRGKDWGEIIVCSQGIGKCIKGRSRKETAFFVRNGYRMW